MPGTVAAAVSTIGPAIAGAGSAVAGAASAAAPFIGPAGTILKGINSLTGSGAASNAGQGAAAGANAFNQQIYAAEQANLNPFILSGQSANNELGGLLGLNGNTNAQNAFDTFRKSSPYQFQLDQGLKGIATENAAQYGSGATAKALNNYAQGMAGTSLNNYMAQLGFLNNSGQSAAGTLGNFGNFANQQNANNLYSGANALGYGAINGANAQNGAINDLTGQLSSFLKPSSTSSYANTQPILGNSGGGILNNMPDFTGTHDYSGVTLPGTTSVIKGL